MRILEIRWTALAPAHSIDRAVVWIPGSVSGPRRSGEWPGGSRYLQVHRCPRIFICRIRYPEVPQGRFISTCTGKFWLCHAAGLPYCTVALAQLTYTSLWRERERERASKRTNTKHPPPQSRQITRTGLLFVFQAPEHQRRHPAASIKKRQHDVE